MKTQKRRMTYKQFAKRFGVTSLDVPKIKQIAKENNITIDDLHNVIDDAKLDGRL